MLINSLRKLLVREDDTKVVKIALHETFKTQSGDIVLAYWAKKYFLFSSTMGETPEETAFNEGARSVVLSIFKTINQDPLRFEKYLNADGQSKES